MNYSLEIYDVRGGYPLKTGKAIPFSRASRAKEFFEKCRLAYEVEADACEFMLGLNFDGSLAELICISEKGFTEIIGEAPESNSFYKQQRGPRAALTIAEQRNLRTICGKLKQIFPDREFNDDTIVEEMIGASAVNSNFSRCSNCNLPMYVEVKEDHRCFRCGKEELCSYCLTSHGCRG